MAYFFRLDRPKDSITAGACVHAVVVAASAADAIAIDPTNGQRDAQWVPTTEVTATLLGPASENFRCGHVVKTVYAKAGVVTSEP